MSRLTGKDAKNLREAYSTIYAPQITEEQVWEEVEEWVNSLVEEGYDLSEYSWEEMYEEYLNEKDERWGPVASDPRWGVIGQIERARQKAFGTGREVRDATSYEKSINNLQRRGVRNPTAGQISAETRGRRMADPNYLGRRDNKEEPRRRKEEPTPTPPPAPARQPAGAPPAKPAGAASSSPKPAPAGQTGDKAKDMDTWAKANPKLAAAAAERQRIRGTQQTDNPLMKDFRSRLPMNSPSVQSPDVAKLGAGNQSLTQNPNALKAATPASTPKSTPSTTSPSTPAAQKPTPRVVQTSTPASVANPFKSPGSLSAATSAVKSATSAKPPEKRQTQLFHTDLYDLVKGHLLDEGYADSEESALAIMANMSEEWRESIIEEIGIVGPPKKAIDKIPGVRGMRIAASNALKASDYPAGENVPKVGKHVIPTERSSPTVSRVRPTNVLGGQDKYTGYGRTAKGYKDVSGD